MPKRSVIFAAIAAVTLAGVAAWWVYADSQRVPQFYRDARAELGPLHGPLDSVSLPPDVMLRSFPNGDGYAVVLEHACCTGGGFDAVMIKDSQGTFYTAEKNYCGYEGFHVGDDNIANLAQLRTALLKEGYKAN